MRAHMHTHTPEAKAGLVFPDGALLSLAQLLELSVPGARLEPLGGGQALRELPERRGREVQHQRPVSEKKGKLRA